MFYNPDTLISVFSFKGKYGGKPRVVNDNLMCCCPFPHLDSKGVFHYEKSPSFGVSLSSGRWQCFSCKMKGITLHSLADSLGIESSKLPFRSADNLAVREVEAIPSNMLELLTRNKDLAQKYLESRGIVGDNLEVGAANDSSVIYFPIKDKSKSLVGWAERIVAEKAWFLKPSGVSKDNLLYGIDNLTDEKYVYVVESVIDKLKLTSWGFPAISTCGASVTEAQISRILDLGKVPHLIPHRDTAGDVWFRKLYSNMRGSVLVYGVNLPSMYKDVGEVEDKDIFLDIKDKRTFLVKSLR